MNWPVNRVGDLVQQAIGSTNLVLVVVVVLARRTEVAVNKVGIIKTPNHPM